MTAGDAAGRLAVYGPNAVASHRAWALPVLLLLAATLASAFLGEGTDAIIIGVIVALSVGLEFATEYRAERAAQGAAFADPPRRGRDPGRSAGAGGRDSPCAR